MGLKICCSKGRAGSTAALRNSQHRLCVDIGRNLTSINRRLRPLTTPPRWCVWLYFRFALSFRDVEEMLAMRGVALTYETVANGALSLVRLMPMAYVTSLLAQATYGT
jgi:hypothetical protein